jgi:Chaperone of endosialidase
MSKGLCTFKKIITMTRKLLLVFACVITRYAVAQNQNVGIGTTTPNASAQLDITSTSKGLLLPRMTTAQRTAIAAPATGLIVFDTSTNGYWYYNGVSWIQLFGGSSTNFWSPNGTHVYNNNSGYVGIGTNAPDHKLSIFNNVVESNNNSNLLKLSGQNPVLTFTDQNNIAYGFLKGCTTGPGGGFSNGLLIGALPGLPIFLSTNYFPVLTIAGNNQVGIGNTAPTSALSFGNIAGNKISLYNSDPNNEYGFGIGAGTMQLYTAAGQTKIAFGYGNSNAFNETMSYYTGTGQLSIGTTVAAGKLHLAADLEALRITGNQSFISFYNGTNYKGYLWNKGTNDMELGTGGVNSSGNLYLSLQGNPMISINNGITPNVQIGRPYPNGSIMNVYGFLDVIDASGSGTDKWELSSETFVGQLRFYKNGGLKCGIDNNGNYIQVSDARLKENFVLYKPVLDNIKKLHVLTYHYKSDNQNTKNLGLVAQNVKEYFPEIVSLMSNEKAEKLLGIDYAKVGVLAIKAIQEQQVIIEQQQQKIESFEKEITILKEQNEKILAALGKLIQNKQR